MKQALRVRNVSWAWNTCAESLALALLFVLASSTRTDCPLGHSIRDAHGARWAMYITGSTSRGLRGRLAMRMIAPRRRCEIQLRGGAPEADGDDDVGMFSRNSSPSPEGRAESGWVGMGGPRYRHEAGDALDKEENDHEWKGENTLGDHMQVA